MSASFAELLLFLSLSLSPQPPRRGSWGVACKGKMGCMLCDLDLVSCSNVWNTCLHNGQKIIDILWLMRIDDLKYTNFCISWNWAISGSIAHYGCPFNLKILFFSVWFPSPQLNCWFLVFNSMVDSSSTEFWIRHLCTPWYFTHFILLFHVSYCRLVNIVLSIGHLACSVQTIFVFLLRLSIWEELKTCPLE